MSGRINRDDPAYANAMREAKAQFDAAMAKSAMKGRGRSAAKPAAVTPEEAEAADAAELKADLETVLDAEQQASAAQAASAAPAAASEPESPAPRPKKGAKARSSGKR